MELKVKTPTFPEVIEFNFQELKQEITERASAYVNLVYTEEQIQDAKKDRATLNKFVKALSDERIKIKKECMKPYEDFEKKIKELDGIVNTAIKNIDKQVKGYEEKKKADKLDEIKNYWNSCTPPFPIKFEQIYESKWLNASVSMKSIQTEIDAKMEQISSDLITLENLPEFGFEATEVYKTTLNLSKAISEGQRLSEIAKRKAEHEAEQARLAVEAVQHPTSPIGQAIESIERQAFENATKPPVEDVPAEPLKEYPIWVGFKALLTVEQAKELKLFFESRNIEFKAI